ncbi:hypothetical protein [Abyssibacter profundi]|uniref:Uncharacterized protein n=1 Tax=Abyssibacter profundi TaxID=2182787 RepID=A0A363ULJ0_9GAMM|nr:hypothetical protein [Abyssibacter profundi]MBV61962.1 hypothetical protein [Nevskiales bacterium]PWN56288.1 hypothetical protein DEH80_08470 [Abyssibacter profundi]
MSKDESKGIRRGVLAARYGAARVIDAEASEQDSQRLKARLHRQAKSSGPAAARASNTAPPEATPRKPSRARPASPTRSSPAPEAPRSGASDGRAQASVAPRRAPPSADGHRPPATVDQVAIIRQAEMHPADALTVVTAPDSEEARRYRSLLARLTPRLDRMGDHATLAVVSVGRSTRRSAVPANLAVLLARAGRATCLVDVGLQGGLAAGLYGLSNAVGLAEWLAGDQRLTAYRFDDLDQFTLIPGGRTGAANNERLMHPRFRDWLTSGLKQPGLILLDATQVDGSADAQAIASVVGHAVIVLCKDDDRLADAHTLVDELRAQNVDIVGSVYLEDTIA